MIPRVPRTRQRRVDLSPACNLIRAVARRASPAGECQSNQTWKRRIVEIKLRNLAPKRSASPADLTPTTYPAAPGRQACPGRPSFACPGKNRLFPKGVHTAAALTLVSATLLAIATSPTPLASYLSAKMSVADLDIAQRTRCDLLAAFRVLYAAL